MRETGASKGELTLSLEVRTAIEKLKNIDEKEQILFFSLPDPTAKPQDPL
jgi:hypothetical protein